MSLGKNLQFLRKQKGAMSQEKLAEQMSVSRQAVSKWESDEVYPEVDKLLALSNLFGCSMDQLLRDDMAGNGDVYSPVRIETVKRFRMARYVMISPVPEDDVNGHMMRWAQESGLLEEPGYTLQMIGWDFPYVSPEQQNRFGLRGYAAACIIPDNFVPKQPCRAELAWQEEGEYAVITVRDPFAAAFERIPGAYKAIMEHLNQNGLKSNPKPELLTCFERIYEKDGICHMDVYISTDATVNTKAYTEF